jgi:hypothetical protein
MRPFASKLMLDNWPIRRRWLRLALIWMAVNVQIILITSFFKLEMGESALYQNAVITFTTAIVSLLGFYVFGSVFDDKNKLNSLNDSKFEDEPVEPRREDRL